jgi:pectate lyase
MCARLVLCLLFLTAVPSGATLPSNELWREAILSQCMGAACSGLTGGGGGTLCTVSSNADSGANTLRACAQSPTTNWIVFSFSGTITVQSPIYVASNKTIDGRTADITLTSGTSFCPQAVTGPPPCDSAVLMLGDYTINTGTAVTNVLITNLKLRNIVGNVMVAAMDRTSKVWLDHLDLQNPADETMFIGQGQIGGLNVPPVSVTVSWTRFRQRDLGVAFPDLGSPGCTDQGFPHWCSKSLLASGTSTQNSTLLLTAHHNWLQSDGRNPHLREGRMHGFNNYHDARTVTAGGGSPWSDFCGNPAWYFSENDIYDHNNEVEPMINGNAAICGADTGTIKATGALLLNGAQLYTRNPGSVPDPATFYSYTATTANETLRQAIMAGAGWQNVTAPVTSAAPQLRIIH